MWRAAMKIRPMARALPAAGLTLVPALLAPQPAHCAAASSTGLPAGLPAGLPDISTLQLQVVGVSGVTGYTAGYAAKRAFKVFIFTSGCIFMGLQTLAQNGLITVHWEEMQKKMLSTLDMNGDNTM